MGNVIRDSIGTNKEHSSLKLSVYSTFISKLDKTMNEIWTISFKIFQFINFPFLLKHVAILARRVIFLMEKTIFSPRE